MKSEDNYYEILGVSVESDQQEITRAFKQALKELPENPVEAAKRRDQLEKSYYFLGDELRRFEYDRMKFNKKLPVSSADNKPLFSEPTSASNALRRKESFPQYPSSSSPGPDRGNIGGHNEDKRPNPAILIGLFLFVFVLGKVWLPGDVPSSPPRNMPAFNYNWPQPAFDPLKLPPNGEVHYYITSQPMAPFSIDTAEGANYFIKLVDGESGAVAVTIFVRGGELVETKIPLGNYKFRYASGYDWYGEEYLFGAGTICAKADKDFHFYQYDQGVMGHKVSLIKHVDGNLHTRQIDPGRF